MNAIRPGIVKKLIQNKMVFTYMRYLLEMIPGNFREGGM